MKKFILCGLLIAPISLMAMDPEPKSEQLKWNPDEYAINNWVQEEAALQILAETEIDLAGLDVIDVGCGSGNLSVKMAKKAKVEGADCVYGFVLGTDTSLEMIKKAKETYFKDIHNVAFECVAAESLTTADPESEGAFDLLTSFFCLNWVKDKQTAFTNFYKVLRPGGKILCTIGTTEEKTVVMGMAVQYFLQLREKYSALKDKSLSELLGRFSIATNDLKALLVDCGFDSVVIEPKIMNFTFKSKTAFADWQRPVFMSSPFVSQIPVEDLKVLFNQFIDKVWEVLAEDADAFRIYPLTTTVVTAQKPG